MSISPRSSYIGRPRLRQPREHARAIESGAISASPGKSARGTSAPALLIALALAAGCGGCAGGLPFEGDLVAVTGATEPAPALATASGLAAEDLVAIGSALGRADGEALTWDNPASGSQGRITRVATIRGPDGDDCRAFRTTVNAVDGVRAVSGVACRRAGGDWTVEGLAPTEEATS